MVDRDPQEGDGVIITNCGDDDLVQELRGEVGIIINIRYDDNDPMYTVSPQGLGLVDLRNGDFILRKGR